MKQMYILDLCIIVMADEKKICLRDRYDQDSQPNVTYHCGQRAGMIMYWGRSSVKVKHGHWEFIYKLRK
jgi:hypothetical protein